jgi:lipopolysaccharide transport system ATP-binding protein
MVEAAVRLLDVGKQYRIDHERNVDGRLSESLTQSVGALLRGRRPRRTTSTETFWALRGIDLEVRRGDVLGIVGRNGAGKTTLLKILSRITEPTTGRVELRGQVSSLLEVGTGFHMELTGRENVYLSGAILGMRQADIRRRFDEIVDFSEVERFLDTPVKRYSSGMLVRLGFAVAAHLEPDILVVDEVLAVGDAAFRRKCLAKMEGVSHDGRTVLFVSHSMPAIEALCTRGIVLEQGSIKVDGTARDIVEEYARIAAERRSIVIAERTDREGTGRMRILAIESEMRTGAESTVRFTYEGQPRLRNVEIIAGLYTERGEGVASLSTKTTMTTFPSLPPAGTLVCVIPRTPLVAGTYSVSVTVLVNGEIADLVRNAATVDVAAGDFFGSGQQPAPQHGHVMFDHRWQEDRQ